MSDLCDLSLEQLSAKIHAGSVSPLEATDACLQRIESRDGELNAFLTVTAESAREEATRLGEELAAGKWRGPLHGVPLALKDLYLTKGVRTTAGSVILGDWVPDHDATVVRRLRQAGAVLLGKLGMHEFAYGPTSVNPHYGSTRNPANPEHMTGGSSGGSGTAVGAGFCFGALGSDTGGSIRCPAALCGIVGLKPTYGRVSRAGVLPLAWSLDHVGPMTRTVMDSALLLEALAGSDPEDATCSGRMVPPYGRLLAEVRGKGLEGVRLGVPEEMFWDPIQPGVAEATRSAIARLEAAGATVQPVSIPSLDFSFAPQTVILASEATAYHLETLRRHADRYDPAVRVRLLQGLFYTGADYVNAQRAQRRLREEMLAILRQVDALVTPTVPLVAPRLDATEIRVGDVTALPAQYLVRNTSPFNLTGLPAISVPCGLSEGLPVGLQIAGRPWDESMIFRIAQAAETA